LISLGFSIEGPSQARIECNDNGDGSADVRYWPTIPGEYAVHILCNDEDIPHSPFMAWIEPPGNFDPKKVNAYGPGLESTGQLIDKPTEFTVETHNAGEAPLRVQAIDQDYQPIDVQVRNNGNGTYTCRYTPRNSNRHCISIDYGGVAIPKSPFRVIFLLLFFSLDKDKLTFRFGQVNHQILVKFVFTVQVLNVVLK